MLIGGSGEGAIIDSDRESNKSDDSSDVVKEQPMFVWNPKYEVSQLGCIYFSVCWGYQWMRRTS